MRSATLASLGTAAIWVAATSAAEARPKLYDCALSREAESLRLKFDLDPGSFALPLDARDPPRRTVSRVHVDGSPFEAEALLTETGTRGFWAADRGWLLTMTPAGAARMSDERKAPWVGHCEETS